MGNCCCPFITSHDMHTAVLGCHQFLGVDICLLSNNRQLHTSTCLENRTAWGKLRSQKPWEFSSECSACLVRWTGPSLPYILSMQHVSLLTMQQGELTACSFGFAFCSHALFMSSFQLWSQRSLSKQDWENSHIQRNPLHDPSSPLTSNKMPPPQ